MGKRKGKKSSKSRKKNSSKAGKDGSLQKEPSRNYSQSKSIITNAHGLPNLQQFSTAAPYIPPQTMQRLISQKMVEEEQKLNNLEDSIRQAYQKHEKRDRLTHQTQVGIHKDDIDFHMNGISIKDIASQGQKRSLVLSMKLALCQIIYEKQKEYPVLLLDDVFSELDVSRSRQLISILPESMQVFISSTDKLDRSLFQNKDVRYYEIIQGHCKEESR